MSEKQLPFSIEAEMSVIGGMFISAEAIPVAMEHVTEADFYREPHRRLYRAITSLWGENATVDYVTIVDRLKVGGDFEASGGAMYISELLEAVPSASNIEYHCRIVARHAARRRLAEAAEQIGELIRGGAALGAEELQAEAQQLISNSGPRQNGSGLVSVGSMLDETLTYLESLVSNESIPLGLSTGLGGVDEKLGPMAAGDLVLLAARPSMGKSALAVCNIAMDVVLRQRKTCALFTIETRKEGVMSRLYAAEGRVNVALAKKRRTWRDEDYPGIASTTGKLKHAKLFIDHTPGLTVEQIRLKLRRMEAETGKVDLVVVDYLQMMTNPKSKSRYEEVSVIGAGLKRIASEFNCVMLALSQLSRAVEQRPDKRPMMSDLRESGTLEQDADVIMLLYRPEYYFGPSMQVRDGKETRKINVEGKAEVILAKVRDGETGSVAVGFEKEYTRFVDLHGGYR